MSMQEVKISMAPIGVAKLMHQAVNVMHQQGILCNMQVWGAKLYQDFSSGIHKY